jgi:hypothetical protein
LKKYTLFDEQSAIFVDKMGGRGAALERKCCGRLVRPPQAPPPVHGPPPHIIILEPLYPFILGIYFVTFFSIPPLVIPVVVPVELVCEIPGLLRHLRRLLSRAKPHLLLAIDDALWLCRLCIGFEIALYREYRKLPGGLEILGTLLVPLALSLVRLSARIAVKPCKKAIEITLKLSVRTFGILFFFCLLSVELVSELLPLDTTSSSSASASTKPQPPRMPMQSTD